MYFDWIIDTADQANAVGDRAVESRSLYDRVHVLIALTDVIATVAGQIKVEDVDE